MEKAIKKMACGKRLREKVIERSKQARQDKTDQQQSGQHDQVEVSTKSVRQDKEQCPISDEHGQYNGCDRRVE